MKPTSIQTLHRSIGQILHRSIGQTLYRSIITILAILGSLVLAQNSGPHSMRSELANLKALVSMTAAKPLSIGGFKQSYSYWLTLRDHKEGKGNTSFSLILSSRTGQASNLISLAYTGPPSDAAVNNLMTLLQYLNAICLGNRSAATINAMWQTLSKTFEASSPQKPASASQVYGSLHFSASNVVYTPQQVRFVLTISNQAQIGQNGWTSYCTANN